MSDSELVKYIAQVQRDVSEWPHWKKKLLADSLNPYRESEKGTSEHVSEKQPPKISDLAMLVGRLVWQVRKHDPENPVAKKAMDYLRRKDLRGSILREFKPPASGGEEK